MAGAEARAEARQARDPLARRRCRGEPVRPPPRPDPGQREGRPDRRRGDVVRAARGRPRVRRDLQGEGDVRARHAALGRLARTRYASLLPQARARRRAASPSTATGSRRWPRRACARPGRQGRISVRFGRMLRPRARGRLRGPRRTAPPTIGADHVRAARARPTARLGRRGAAACATRSATGLILVQTKGARVGQVNGLAVYDFGDHRFGKVARITAAVGAGQAGVVNVERLAELSGSSHDKGVLILSAATCARRSAPSTRPGVHREPRLRAVVRRRRRRQRDVRRGRSRSSPRSSRVPVRQDLAVTGSMNQHGDVQAVGGVNDKIEGFFDVCAERGLSGTQGVDRSRARTCTT